MTRIIDRSSLNKQEYESKIVTAKRLKEKLINKEKPSKEELAEAFKDITMFSYLFFRVDGKPLELYPYQDKILNEPHRFKIFRSSNQSGKSLALDVKAAYNLMMDNGKAHNEAIVSKSLPQSLFQMRRVKGLLNTARNVNWNEEKGSADSMSVVTCDIKDKKGNVKYTNMLICAPSTEGLLGYDLHELNLDEFEYWDVDIRWFFNQIAQPRTYTTKGNITIFSNPNGADSFVADLERQKTTKGALKWKTYVFNYMDKPGNTQEEYDQLKHELNRQEFESTVAAIRSISDRNYFTAEEIEKSYDPSLNDTSMVGKQPFFFLDVGAKHDQSVLVGGFVEVDEDNDKLKHIHIPIIHVYPVGYPLTRVVGVPISDGDGWHYEKSVKEHLAEWTIEGIRPVFGVDVTGNSGIQPLFEAVGVGAQDITFSGPSKSGMFQRMKYFMEKGLLHRVKCKEWEYQARHLEVRKSVRGYLMIHHENEKDLDDCMDSTCAMIHLADSPLIIEPSIKII